MCMIPAPSQVPRSRMARGRSHSQHPPNMANFIYKWPPPGGLTLPGSGSAGPASAARTCASIHSAALLASGPGPHTAAARSPPFRSCGPQPGAGGRMLGKHPKTTLAFALASSPAFLVYRDHLQTS